MYGYTKARRAKRLMRLFIEKGWQEEAALIGLLYQTPIRIREALQLKKSDIDGSIRRMLCGSEWKTLPYYQTTEKFDRFR